MKAMILAAGVGSRLRPLTDETPKALIPVGDKTMIEIVLGRLAAAGVRQVVVNTHHRAQQLESFIARNAPKDVQVSFSREETLLDTGGGLKKVAPFFDEGEPFFLHNVDVLCDLDLGLMYRSHVHSRALATLAVQERKTARLLLFDQKGLLQGRENAESGSLSWAANPVAPVERLAFCGIHVISARFLSLLDETGVFSIMNSYLRLAGSGEKIAAFRADGCYWQDIGTAEKLEQARRRTLKSGPPR